jgi:REP element-mobilizing transposase RayT
MRGNHREDLFATPEDRLVLNNIVAEALEYYAARVHAYCWMTNHLHALVQVGTVQLGKLVQRIGGRYARYRNRQLNTTGHQFEQRYGATLVETDLYFITLLRYIHWNPVKARMVTRLEDYEWSSHRFYLGLVTPQWLTTDFGLSLFGTTIDSAHEAYRCLMSQALTASEESILEQANPADRRVLGSDEFLERLPAFRFKPRSSLTLSDLVLQVCGAKGVTVEEVCSPSKAAQLSKARAEIVKLAIDGRIASINEVARYLNRHHSALSRLFQRHSKHSKG